jgi:23S rRNA (uracil1939-C5)-methyltransferase
LFTTALAPSFRHILAVESSQSSATDLKYNCPANGKVVRTTVEEYLIGAVHPGKGKPGKLQSGKTKSATPGLPVPDLVIVDPPRAGVGDRVAKALAGSAAPRITYVSCDPATLARDLVHLIAGGYRVDQVHLVDLFPQTFHLESVVHLVR